MVATRIGVWIPGHVTLISGTLHSDFELVSEIQIEFWRLGMVRPTAQNPNGKKKMLA
jgi:hypothetical protein